MHWSAHKAQKLVVWSENRNADGKNVEEKSFNREAAGHGLTTGTIICTCAICLRSMGDEACYIPFMFILGGPALSTDLDRRRRKSERQETFRKKRISPWT